MNNNIKILENKFNALRNKIDELSAALAIRRESQTFSDDLRMEMHECYNVIKAQQNDLDAIKLLIEKNIKDTEEYVVKLIQAIKVNYILFKFLPKWQCIHHIFQLFLTSRNLTNGNRICVNYFAKPEYHEAKDSNYACNYSAKGTT